MDYFTSDRLVEPSKGDILISEPYLPDPNFVRTVILICEHDENGTIGFVLNRSAKVKLPDVVDGTEGFEAELFIGGPVERDTLHFLHRSDLLRDTSKEIIDRTWWGLDFDKLADLIETGLVSQSDLRFFMGYSGWSSGQLMEEMKAKSWIVLKNVTQEMIFDWDNQELWKACLNSMGGKYKLISTYPKDPRMN